MKQNICISDYDYPLPEERIAKFPLERREQSKLLLCRDGRVSEDRFFEVGKYLPEGSPVGVQQYESNPGAGSFSIRKPEPGSKYSASNRMIRPITSGRSPPKEVLSGRASSVT